MTERFRMKNTNAVEKYGKPSIAKRAAGLSVLMNRPTRTLGEQSERRRDYQSASHRRKQRYALRGRYAVAAPQSEVITDDWLCRLRYGVTDHKDERCVVTGDAKSTYAVAAKILHEHVIAHEHQHGHGQFRQQCRRTYAALVADVPHRKAQALDAPLQAVWAQLPGKT